MTRSFARTASATLDSRSSAGGGNLYREGVIRDRVLRAFARNP